MTREKILVIDDEKTTLKMFGLFLDIYGYEILTAESGEEGLEVFDRERPEIVLTDIKMPGMDGIAVLQEIKRRSPATEVIVITGHGDMDLAIQALNLDAADFINKPIQRQSLEQGLSRARERLKLARSRQNEVSTREMGSALVRRVVLHFDPNTSINGAGIAILTQLVLESEKDGIEIVMAGLSENFRKVFGIVGLSRMVQVFDNLDQACS
jgi:YesN/AraC family two-component response regulator